jgi:hypothetical protein
MAGISHLKNRAKKLGRESFEALKGRRHSIVYMDAERNILWDEKVNYNEGVLAIPSPMTMGQWQERCKGVKL